jgi:hypothetical protein
MLDKLAKKGLSISVIVGTLLVPLTALAAIWLTDPGRGGEEEQVPITPAPVGTVTTQPTAIATGDIAANLQTACGPEGLQLVSLEASASITDVQQAALDSLREVCEQEGIPLPPKPNAEPIVQTVMVPAPAAASPVPVNPPTTLDDDHDEDDDLDEDDDHDDENEEDDL